VPRGRPKRVEEEAPTDQVLRVAEIIQKYCYTPGCLSKLHLEEAKEIVASLKDENK
jgi:hypothetical protein